MECGGGGVGDGGYCLQKEDSLRRICQREGEEGVEEKGQDGQWGRI